MKTKEVVINSATYIINTIGTPLGWEYSIEMNDEIIAESGADFYISYQRAIKTAEEYLLAHLVEDNSIIHVDIQKFVKLYFNDPIRVLHDVLQPHRICVIPHPQFTEYQLKKLAKDERLNGLTQSQDSSVNIDIKPEYQWTNITH